MNDSPGKPRPWRGIGEAALLALWVWAFIWWIHPLGRPWLSLASIAGMLFWVLAGVAARGLTLRELGFSWEEFPPALKWLCIPTLVVVAGTVTLGLMRDTSGTPRGLFADALQRLLTYPLWALIQQVGLQWGLFVPLREGLRSPRAAAVVSALLFAAVHFPNAPIMVGGFLLALGCCLLFDRAPQLLALALSHGIMGAFYAAFLADWHWAGSAVGPKVWYS